MGVTSLPQFVRSRRKGHGEKDVAAPSLPESPLSGPGTDQAHSPDALKKATRARRRTIFIASGFYFISIIFLILVEIGNTHDSPQIRDMYFYKLDLTDIIPVSVPNAVLINSIARSLGLHDFYQVGLWNFCEGYNDQGIVYCSTPERFYWFNPVKVLTSELLSGASIALPTTVNDILSLIRIASQCMWGFFMTGIILNFILMVMGPIAVFSRWWSLPFGVLSSVSSLLIVAGSGVATAMSVIFRWALTQQNELNIHAQVGIRMLVFMWVASLATVIPALMHSGLGCFCPSKRDVTTGRKSLFMSRHSPHLKVKRGAETVQPAEEEKS
ncbi:SUR7 family protein pun1 [Zalerion maritima]|uniref:SUR7 family protein pun1 n=1 Tax=Zalerion maritima TaxID=339359 RepID=A0AAD5RMP5_9PEZI|nr:SUR7 family protein pun1 [Zalerion maritima]